MTTSAEIFFAGWTKGNTTREDNISLNNHQHPVSHWPQKPLTHCVQCVSVVGKYFHKGGSR